MSYVLVGILFLVIASAFVAYLVVTSSRRSGQGGGEPGARDGGETGAPGIGADETPFGDTNEHAGDTRSSGETVGGQDADQAGGTGRPVLSGDTDDADDTAGEPGAPDAGRRFQRDPVGGEAEARPFTET